MILFSFAYIYACVWLYWIILLLLEIYSFASRVVQSWFFIFYFCYCCLVKIIIYCCCSYCCCNFDFSNCLLFFVIFSLLSIWTADLQQSLNLCCLPFSSPLHILLPCLHIHICLTRLRATLHYLRYTTTYTHLYWLGLLFFSYICVWLLVCGVCVYNLKNFEKIVNVKLIFFVVMCMQTNGNLFNECLKN